MRANSGVKGFDRSFQVRPYGTFGDDWLDLGTDTARNARDPVSSVMTAHYPMPSEVKNSTALNWMLRLPEDRQLVGIVQVLSHRQSDRRAGGLVAAADREGFLDDAVFAGLKDLIRGAVEAIAFVDRELSLKEAEKKAEQQLAEGRQQTRDAIVEIESDRTLTMPQRVRIVQILEESQERSEREIGGKKEREQQLEVMSLLGVVGGFMTHEFGVALAELRAARRELAELAAEHASFGPRVEALDASIAALKGFVAYSRAYVGGVRNQTGKPYAVRPRLSHVSKAFGPYAEKRQIEVPIDVDRDVIAPAVPPSLYDGIAQNLFTNALKALTRSEKLDRRIVFRAWNEGSWHRLQVSDTGDGIPAPIKDLVFDPLFTTTESRNADPLGSGMGLGLALVRRGAQAFGGAAELVDPPPGFATCVQVRLPREVAQ